MTRARFVGDAQAGRAEEVNFHFPGSQPPAPPVQAGAEFGIPPARTARAAEPAKYWTAGRLGIVVGAVVVLFGPICFLGYQQVGAEFLRPFGMALAIGGAGVAVFFAWAAPAIMLGRAREAETEGRLLGYLLGPVGALIMLAIDHRPQCPACGVRCKSAAAWCPGCGRPR